MTLSRSSIPEDSPIARPNAYAVALQRSHRGRVGQMAEVRHSRETTLSSERQRRSARVVVAIIIAVLAMILIDRGYQAITQRSHRKAMSGTNDTPAEEDSPEMVEVETEGVDEEGNLVIDDLVVALDSEGNIVATDETVAVIRPEGDAVVDEKLSVMGKDGKLHAAEEDVSIFEIDDE